MAAPSGTVWYTKFLKSKEYFRLLHLLYPKVRKSKWISKIFYNQEGSDHLAVCFLRPCLRRGYGLIFPAPPRKSSRRKQRRSSPNIPRNQKIAGGKHGNQEQMKPKEPSQIRRFLIFRGSAFPNDGRRHQGRPFDGWGHQASHLHRDWRVQGEPDGGRLPAWSWSLPHTSRLKPCKKNPVIFKSTITKIILTFHKHHTSCAWGA